MSKRIDDSALAGYLDDLTFSEFDRFKHELARGQDPLVPELPAVSRPSASHLEYSKPWDVVSLIRWRCGDLAVNIVMRVLSRVNTRLYERLHTEHAALSHKEDSSRAWKCGGRSPHPKPIETDYSRSELNSVMDRLTEKELDI